MSSAPDQNMMREAVREALRELLPDTASIRTAGDDPEVVPLVPAPPVAAVLRPSTWRGPAIPGEVVGSAAVHASTTVPDRDPSRRGSNVPASSTSVSHTAGREPPQIAAAAERSRSASTQAAPRPGGPADATIETVTIDGDEDLQEFVRSLVRRLESPRDRLAIKAGRLRFTLHRSAAAVGPATDRDASPIVHIPRGAVTERQVREAHDSGSRLVLARAAVPTPLARETARKLGVQIERERSC